MASEFFVFLYLKNKSWNFPCGPVVKSLPSNSQDVSLMPGQRTKIPHATEQLSL